MVSLGEDAHYNEGIEKGSAYPRAQEKRTMEEAESAHVTPGATRRHGSPWSTTCQVCLVFLLGIPAVVLLVVANEIVDGNDRRFQECRRKLPHSPFIQIDGCGDTGPYVCKSPHAPTQLAAIAAVLLLFSVIAGVDFNCLGWCPCAYPNWRKGLDSAVAPYSLASMFLFLQLGSAAWFCLMFVFWAILTSHLTNPLASPINRHMCCCKYWGSSGRLYAGPGIMAGAAAASIIFGTCHLVAAKTAFLRWRKYAL